MEEPDGGINVYDGAAPVERNARQRGITPVRTHMAAVSTNVYLHYHQHSTASSLTPLSVSHHFAPNHSSCIVVVILIAYCLIALLFAVFLNR